MLDFASERYCRTAERDSPCFQQLWLLCFESGEIFGGKGEAASRGTGRGTQGRYGNCSMRTNGVAPRRRKVLHTHPHSSLRWQRIASHRPRWNYWRFLQPRKELNVPRLWNSRKGILASRQEHVSMGRLFQALILLSIPIFLSFTELFGFQEMLTRSWKPDVCLLWMRDWERR